MQDALSPFRTTGAQVELPGRGVGLWTEIRGDGPPLVLIGGMGTHLAHWRPEFLSALTGRQLILFEHRGVNRSTPVRHPFTVSDLADDAAALMSRLGLEQADLIGFSMGGMVAQELALRHSATTGQLVLIGTGAGGPPDPIPAEVWETMWSALRGGDADRAIATTWAFSVSEGFASDASYDDWQRAALSGAIRPRVVSWQHDAVLGHDAVDRLGTLGRRATVLHGSHDRVVPPDRAQALADALSCDPVRWIEGAGHACLWEAPTRAAALVHQALSDHEQRR